MDDWDTYIKTGMLERPEEFERINAGAIKTTYSIDTDSNRYILQTTDPGSADDLHLQREVYNDLDDTVVPAPSIVHDAADRPVPYQILEYVPDSNMDELYSHETNEKLRKL
ncbi:MAG: phosphotransferase, partial [Candidatus Nanohaloarchaea archaeon]|nr:phosphotransferase [Candidatus Nanohaloarchaea archaeon]